MFGKFRFGMQAEAILLKEFNYDSSKLLPALRDNWIELKRNFYAAGSQPTDAAVLFMLAQINRLSVEARNGEFATGVLRAIDRLQGQMSVEARADLPRWLDEFRRETERLTRDPDATLRNTLARRLSTFA